MKKLLFFILLFFVGVTAAFAQAPTHEQLTYQTVVRNAQNQLAFNLDNVTVKVYVCSDAAGTNVVYSETHTGLSTNANGMLSMMIGSVVPDEGTWAGIDWSTAYIKTTISYNPGSGTVTITHDPAPVTAVPYALSAGNMSNITNIIGDAIHDSIVNNISTQIHDSIVYNINNNISEQIHDSIVNYLTASDYVTASDLCTTIETNCDNVPLKNGDNVFTGTNTVPRGFDIHTTDESNCNNVVVNACDLFAVFDSLNTRFNAVYDSLARLSQALEDLMNSVPPTANAPTVSDVSSNAMTATANATSTGAPITSYEFCISANSDMSGATCQTVPAADADHYTFTGLTGNTNYYVQYKATNVAGTTTSPVVQQRTPAHAPTADVSAPTSAKPAGFKVEVTDIDPKEGTESTIQVCYVLKGSGDCPDKESTEYADCSVVTGTADTIISVMGFTPSTEYCAIVKVSNEDSTTIYGPYTVTTGADVTMTISGPSDTNRCGSETINVPFTATITGDNASDFTYTWSAGTSTTHLDTVSLGATSTITVTATHATEGYTLTASHTVTVQNGTAVSFGLCVNDGLVTVKETVSGSPTSIAWGDGSNGSEVTANVTTHTYATSGTYTITAANATCSKSMIKNIIVPTTVADRTVRPCTIGSHAVQTAGIGNASDGLETANGSGQITSVKDYDGNEYPVAEIGSQCWTAVNLRTTHYANGTAIPEGTTLSSSEPYYYNNDASIVPLEQRGYYYNAASIKSSPSAAITDICPSGWHTPTYGEWQTLQTNAPTTGLLSGSCYWTDGTSTLGCNPFCYWNPDRDLYGFTALPVGYSSGSSFSSLGNVASFLSSSFAGSGNTSNDPWVVQIERQTCDYVMTVYGIGNVTLGHSVRCVRD